MKRNEKEEHYAGQAAHIASKHGVIGLTKAEKAPPQGGAFSGVDLNNGFHLMTSNHATHPIGHPGDRGSCRVRPVEAVEASPGTPRRDPADHAGPGRRLRSPAHLVSGFDHEFAASRRLVLTDDHWCPVCVTDVAGYARRTERNTFLAQIVEA